MWKKPIQIYLFMLIAFSLVDISKCGKYRDEADKQCKNVDVAEWRMTDEERIQNREDNKTPIKLTTEDISKMLNDSDYSGVIKGVLVYFILVLILLLFILFSFIIYLFFCCCCKEYANPTEGKAKATCLISLVFFVVFTVFFILMIVYIAKTNNKYDEVQCVINRIPADLLEGSETSVYTFMGFKNLQNKLSSLQTEVQNLPSVQSDLDAIVNRNLDTKTTSSFEALPIFYNDYKDRTTRDGEGTTAKPLSVENMTEHVSAPIREEFELYVTIGVSLHNIGERGSRFVNPATASKMSDALQEIVDFLDLLITPLESDLGSINDGMDGGAKYIPIGTYIALGVGIFIFVISTFFMLVLYCQFKKQKCMGITWLLKIGIIIIGLLTLFLAIISIILLIATTGVSSFCEVTEEFLVATNINDVLTEFSITFDDEVISDAFNRCIPANASGDLSSLVGGSGENEEYMNYIEEFLDGLTSFKRRVKVVESGTIDSEAILARNEDWDKIQNGLKFDHNNISNSLSQLNNLIRCGDITFRMNASACTSSDVGCQGIATTDSFSAPSCSSDTSRANTLFTNLRNYYTDTNTLLGNMIDDLGSTTADTPNNRFRTAKQELRDSIVNYNAISSTLSNTIEASAEFDEDFSTLSDCRIIRTQFNNLESVFCFSVNKDIYLFFVFTSIACFLLFMFNWFLCITIRCVAKDTNIKISNSYNNEKNGMYFNDDEKVPI